MTTLMRNGRGRRSENPLLGQAILERVVLIGTDQRITSGPAATAAASQPRDPSERKQAVYMAATRTLRRKSDSFPLQRGRRPYMAHRVIVCVGRQRTELGAHRLSIVVAQSVIRVPGDRAPCAFGHLRPLVAAISKSGSAAPAIHSLISTPAASSAVLSAVSTSAGSNTKRSLFGGIFGGCPTSVDSLAASRSRTESSHATSATCFLVSICAYPLLTKPKLTLRIPCVPTSCFARYRILRLFVLSALWPSVPFLCSFAYYLEISGEPMIVACNSSIAAISFASI